MQERLAGGCQTDVAAVTVKEPDSELIFEPAYLLAERRLRDVESLGGTSEVQLLGQRDEVVDEPQVQPLHRQSLLIGWQVVLDIAPTAQHRVCPRDAQFDDREVVHIPDGSPTTTTRPTLSRKASRRMIDVAIAQAIDMSVPVTVVVVDESGVTKELMRMDGAPLVSVQTAINKAYAAAAIGMPPAEGFRRSCTSRRLVASRR